jgi:hypothetical protein
MVFKTFTLKEEKGIRRDSIETKMRKRSKETDQAKLLPKSRCLVITLDKFNYSF